MTILLAITLIPFLSTGQTTNEDVVYLKNGKVVRGVIIDQVANQSLKIKTSDNKILTFKINEIEKISKPEGILYKKKEKDLNKGIAIGVIAGMDISTISNLVVNDPVTKDSKLGFQGGLIGKYGFSKLLAVQLELLFAQKGYQVEATPDGALTKHFLRLNYLEIPIMAKVSWPMGHLVINGNLGPYLGICLNGYEADDPDAGQHGNINFDQGGFNRIDFGLVFGAGLGYRTGKCELFLDLRYRLGLSDINNRSSLITDGERYLKNSNRSFGIALGVLIPLGK